MSTTYTATSLADGIAALSKGMKKISFGNCVPKVGDEGAIELCRALRKHPDVFWLGLFEQELTNSGLEEILHGLSNNKSLTHLDLGRNPIGDEGVQSLCNFLATNKTVTEVYLWETNLTEEGGKTLESMLHKNRTISNLDVNDNPNLSLEMKSTLAALIKQGPSRVPASPRAGPMKPAHTPH